MPNQGWNYLDPFQTVIQIGTDQLFYRKRYQIARAIGPVLSLQEPDGPNNRAASYYAFGSGAYPNADSPSWDTALAAKTALLRSGVTDQFNAPGIPFEEYVQAWRENGNGSQLIVRRWWSSWFWSADHPQGAEAWENFPIALPPNVHTGILSSIDQDFARNSEVIATQDILDISGYPIPLRHASNIIEDAFVEGELLGPGTAEEVE